MSEANLNVNGATPLMHNALIAQYDAIMAAVKQVNETIPLDAYEIRDEIVAAIANHNPRKGAE